MDKLKQINKMRCFNPKYFINCSFKLFVFIAICQFAFISPILNTYSIDKTSNGNKYFELLQDINFHNGTAEAFLQGLGYYQPKRIIDLIKIIDYLKKNTIKNNILKNFDDVKQNIEKNSTTKTILKHQTNVNYYQHERARKFRDLKKNDFSNEDDLDAKVVSRQTNLGVTRSKRAAIANIRNLWDYGVIPYVIEPTFTTKQKYILLEAMLTWEKSTCLVFKQKKAEDKNYFVFKKGMLDECWSKIGKVWRGRQDLVLGDRCLYMSTVLHELGHTIGYFHEQSRPDRDKFVEVFLKNVRMDKVDQFEKMNSYKVNSLNEPYDFESIMHYRKNDFANKSYPNLVAIIPRRLPGMTVPSDFGTYSKLSPGDIRQTNKLYNCNSCGDTLQEPSGNLSFPPKSGQRKVCQWRISVSHGHRVQFKVTSLNITYSDNCKNNYLELRDGHYIKSRSLGRFCGNKTRRTIISSGRRLWVEFKTSSGLDKFSAEYVTVCGGPIIKDEGFIASPGYPISYLHRIYCVWNITVPMGYAVVIKFNTIDLEITNNCTDDFLEIRDGHESSAALLGRYCGKENPKEVLSTGNNMSLVFKSYSKFKKTRFSLSFEKELDECVTKTHGCDHVCINTIGSYQCKCKIGFKLHSNRKTCTLQCGGTLSRSNGYITSPSFPELYPPNQKCIWTITAPKGHTISLNFTHFDLESEGDNCHQNDYVAVNRRDKKNITKFDFYCGNELPKPIMSKRNELKIMFISDLLKEKSGFAANFNADRNECQMKNGGCGQICDNTVGSYHCSCRSGYILQNDHRTCLVAK